MEEEIERQLDEEKVEGRKGNGGARKAEKKRGKGVR